MMAEKGKAGNSSLSLPTANTARQHLGTKKKSDTKQIHPGYSMFDWNKLCNSGEVDMTGTQGKMLRVSPEELARHSRDGDLWTAVRGVVYNVTHFTKYHPGGKAQLMRGAGRDCTELFDKIHVWVNSESILEKCIVGYLIGAQPPVKSPTLKVPVEKPPFSGGSSDETDLGVDVLSLHVPSVGGGEGGESSSSSGGGGGGKMSMADAGRLQRTMKSPSTDTEDGNSISIPIPVTLAKPQSPQPNLGASARDGNSISIPIPTALAQSQSSYPNLGAKVEKSSIPVLGSKTVESPNRGTSDSVGVSIPVPTIKGDSTPVPSSKDTTSLPHYITDHPLISKTAYETAV